MAKHPYLFSIASLILAVIAPASAFAPAASFGQLSPPASEYAAAPSSVQLHAFLPIDDVAPALVATSATLLDGAPGSAALSSTSISTSGILSTDNIKVAFSVATFFPQLPWLFLILLPNAGVTNRLLGGYGE